MKYAAPYGFKRIQKNHLIALMVLPPLLLGACQNQTKSSEPTVAEEEQATAEHDLRVEILDPAGTQVIDPDAEIEVLTDGHSWTEGPLYIADGDYLIYSDIPPNKIYKWKEGEGKSLFLEPSGYTGDVERGGEIGSNGLLLDPQGRLVLCQHGDRRIARLEAPLGDNKAEFVTVAERYEGKRFNSPNDACYASNGDLYFTDPPYGLEKNMDDPAKELDFQGVYRLASSGKLDLITDELTFPNGIGLSPDEKTLYVAVSDSNNPVWMAYDLDDSGMPQSSRVFFDANAYKKDGGLPDGLKINKDGILFATGPGGVWVFNKEGHALARIRTGQATSNCALTTDEKMLYMTADDYLMRIKLK